MIARRSGKIIHIASLMSDLARPTVVPYTAAKGGVRQLTRGMAVELARTTSRSTRSAPDTSQPK
jgi:gluconate 5-dehydrogenase